MKLLRGSPVGWRAPGRSAVALGVFDGVHLGHRAVIAEVVKRRDLEPVVLTFGTHPAAVLSPTGPPPLLTTLDRRIDLIESAGVGTVAVIEFDEQLRALSPEVFIESYLVQGLAAGHVVAGEDFRFGNRAVGTLNLLESVGREKGFGVTAVGAVFHGGREVRSTTIRSMIEAGDVASAAALLGRVHELSGLVVRGDGRGREIGVPTANLEIPEGLAVPGAGVYVVTTAGAGSATAGVVNIGVRPTFDGTVPTVEVHVLRFDGDLYGQRITIGFVDRIRDEKRFASVAGLVDQIEDDIRAAEAILRRPS